MAGVEEAADLVELRGALKTMLRAIVEKDVSPGMLQELVTSAKAARQLLVARLDPAARPRRRGGEIGLAGDEDVYDAQSSFGGSYGAIQPLGPSLSVSNPAETYGATVIREFIAAAKDFQTPKPKLHELISGLKDAKKAGFKEVAEQIEAQIAAMLPAIDPSVLSIPAKAVE